MMQDRFLVRMAAGLSLMVLLGGAADSVEIIQDDRGGAPQNFAISGQPKRVRSRAELLSTARPDVRELLANARPDVRIERSTGDRARQGGSLSLFQVYGAPDSTGKRAPMFWTVRAESSAGIGGDLLRQDPERFTNSLACPAVSIQLAAMDALPPPRPKADNTGRSQGAEGSIGFTFIEETYSYHLTAPTAGGVDEVLDWRSASPLDPLGQWIDQTFTAIAPCLTADPPKGSEDREQPPATPKP